MMSPSALCFLFLLAAAASEAFVHQLHHQREVSVAHRRAFRPRLHQSTTTTEDGTAAPSTPSAQPRTGLAQSLLNVALSSPLWKYVLVPQARANIVKTAESNGVRWNEALAWIKSQEGPWNQNGEQSCDTNKVQSIPVEYPEYYLKPFHAYDEGNLNWNAAFEQELASRAVGARNFPAYGEAGDDAFRGAFDSALTELGARVSDDATLLVDFGCGTGISTRRLASSFPQVDKIIGIDLSPYFIAVGKKLLELSPKAMGEGGQWVTTIRSDDRMELQVGDCAKTQLPDGCADVVSVGLVVHELPVFAAKAICKEAKRILKEGGQLWLTEMDFDSPAFSAQRSNPLLFSLIRATEPFLDVYADGANELRDYLAKEFECVRIGAATGRHYALVATKGNSTGGETGCTIDDKRFTSDGSYSVADTHLKTWESKRESK